MQPNREAREGKNNFGAKAVPISLIQAKRHISGKFTILDSGKITTMDSGKITTMDSGKVNFPAIYFYGSPPPFKNGASI